MGGHLSLGGRSMEFTKERETYKKKKGTDQKGGDSHAKTKRNTLHVRCPFSIVHEDSLHKDSSHEDSSYGEYVLEGYKGCHVSLKIARMMNAS